MTTLNAFILGMVQGLSEFLPISSSGHLALFQKLFLNLPNNLFINTAAHLGTVLSIFVIYRNFFLQTAQALFQKQSRKQVQQFLALIIIASVPTAALGLTIRAQALFVFNNLCFIATCFAATAGLLLYTHKKTKDYVTQKSFQAHNLKAFTFSTLHPKFAFIIGISQGIAVLPGISRSGATIAVALLLGLKSKTAALFSFIISIPAIFGATLLEITDLKNLSEVPWNIAATSALSAFVFGLVGLSLILHFVKKSRLHLFSIYLIAISLVTFVTATL